MDSSTDGSSTIDTSADTSANLDNSSDSNLDNTDDTSSAVPDISGVFHSTFFGIFFILLYTVLPLGLYCIASYSLSLLDKFYHKKKTSGISWAPFARYFYIVKKET